MRALALGLLRDAGGLQDTSEDVLHALVGRFAVRTIPPGGVVCDQGDTARAVWVVVNGRCTSTFASEAGREVPIDLVGPGQLFGHVGTHTGGPRRAGCRAVDEVTLLELSGPAADALLVEPGPVGAAWRHLLIHTLSHQIAVTDLAFHRLPAPPTQRTLP